MNRVIDRRYRLDEQISAADVVQKFRAFDLLTGEAVCLHLVPPSTKNLDEHKARMEIQYRALKRIRHPSIIQTFSFGQCMDRSVYMCTELLFGKKLSEILAPNFDYAVARASSLIDQMASAVDAVHVQEMVFGFLSPEVVYVYVDQLGVERCKITTLQWHGDDDGKHPSPDYMSPEQALGGHPTCASDIYSLAAIFFHMVAGRPPYDTPVNGDWALVHRQSPIPRISDRNRMVRVSEGMEAVLMRALSRTPADRPESASMFARMLRENESTNMGGVEGLVAAATGSSIRRGPVRQAAPTAVIRPSARVQPAAVGQSAFNTDSALAISPQPIPKPKSASTERSKFIEHTTPNAASPALRRVSMATMAPTQITSLSRPGIDWRTVRFVVLSAILSALLLSLTFAFDN
jgi:serine/threonine-protein kinase